MSFLAGIIKDTQRRSNFLVQRKEEGGEAMPAATPMPAEEPENGAYTIYRFQEAGAFSPVKAARVEPQQGVEGRHSPLKIGKSEQLDDTESKLADKAEVKLGSETGRWKSTASGLNAEVVNDGSAISSIPPLVEDVSAVRSVVDNSLVATGVEERHKSESRSYRQPTGNAAPSENLLDISSQKKSTNINKNLSQDNQTTISPLTSDNRHQQASSNQPSSVNLAIQNTENQNTLNPQLNDSTGSHQESIDSPGSGESLPLDPTDETKEYQTPSSFENQIQAIPHSKPRSVDLTSPIDRKDNDPKVIIGQLEVIVVAPKTADTQSKQPSKRENSKSNSGFMSRNYLRGL